MSWYVLNCRTGQEDEIMNSCRQHLSPDALEETFIFQCERLWRAEGGWALTRKEMFPGYVFLQSSQPELLSKELEAYRKVVRVLEEPGYLISVYEEEEAALLKLCGENHILKMSYGYKDKENGQSYITEGPLCGLENKIKKIDWHKRFAVIDMPVARHNSVVWAGVEFRESCLEHKLKKTAV